MRKTFTLIAALTILTEGILQRKTESINHTGFRSRGWNSW